MTRFQDETDILHEIHYSDQIAAQWPQ